MTAVHMLMLNAGSSSLKFRGYAKVGAAWRSVLQGQVVALGAAAHGAWHDAQGQCLWQGALPPEQGVDATAAVAWLLNALRPHWDAHGLQAVGHRVVHGGARYSGPARVDEALLTELEALIPLAPLHQPHNLAPMRWIAQRWPDVVQVACFDTAFHRTQPEIAQWYALPRTYFAQGVRRYGFHGLSYAAIAQQLRLRAPAAWAGRTVVAHVGQGVSMCALSHGQSVATTMGFTALEGCPMGTRSGSLDPGVVLWLAREQGLSWDAIEHLLYHESGLLGVSGVSGDWRTLEASDAPQAAWAIEWFAYRLARELGSLVAALGGLDALVFTAGIGANSARLRAALCARAAWLGLQMDESANTAGAWQLSAPGSRVAVYRLDTDEEAVMAQQVLQVWQDQTVALTEWAHPVAG